MTHTTDEELIRRTLGGEQRAFAELVGRYERRVIVTIRSVIHDLDHEELEDVAQDVFLLVYRSLPSFRGDAQFGTYVTRIVLRHCWRMAKRRRRRQGTFTSLEENREATGSLRDRAPSPRTTDEELLAEERRKGVREGLQALPEEFRTVLVMRIVEEMPVEQVAEILGISIGTVKSRLYRAREKMREILRPLGLDFDPAAED